MQFKTLKELDSSEGTVQLFEAYIRQRHGVKNDEVIILHPQPSDDPNDPLRWPTWRKNAAFFSVCSFALLYNFSGAVLSDSIFTVSQVLGIGLDEASGIVSWTLLALALSNFFWVPTAVYFGKRPVFIITTAVAFFANIWGGASKSFGSLQAASVVAAFGGGATEALGAAMINDIFFLHEKGSKMGIYTMSIASGSSLGPLCGGYLVQNLGWQWGKWLSAILLGVNLLAMILLVPETQFERRTGLSDGLVNPKSSAQENVGKEDQSDSQVETVASDERASTRESRTMTKEKKSQLQLLKPWSSTNPHAKYLEVMFRPWPLLVYPACIYATLIFSVGLAPSIMINILSSALLIPPPYNFSIGAVGLINIPGLIGQAAGAVLGGVVIDKYSAYRARRRGGVFLPETRLTPIILPSIIVLTGILLFGFAAENSMSWPVIFVAYGFVASGLTSAAGISMTYVMDSYFPVAAECLEMVNAFKNIIAFGFVKATVPWVQNQGFARAFGALAGITCAIFSTTIIFLLWGPKIRHYTSTKLRLITWQLE